MNVMIEVVVRDDSGHMINPPWVLVLQPEQERLVKGSPTQNGWSYEIEVDDE